MPALFDRNYSRNDLLRKIGNVTQLGGTRSVELQDGSERGVRAVDFDTGTGFRFTVLPDRAMDIFSASYCGRSLCWHSPSGAVAPSYYEPQGLGWLRSFPGGLVVTCGLTQAGGPCTDAGEDLGLHGRVSNIPARNVCHGTCWEGDAVVMFAEGNVVQASLFGHQLRLTRRITARIGENRLFLSDCVENIGFEPAPHMIVYHCNFGFPVIDEGTRLISPTESVQPLNADTEKDMVYDTFSGPMPHYSERVYDHKVRPAADGTVRLELRNDSFDSGRGLGAYMTYDYAQLPRLTQWKMLGEGAYVVGLEPGNSSVKGRAAAREKGELVELAPGESRQYALEIGVLPATA